MSGQLHVTSVLLAHKSLPLSLCEGKMRISQMTARLRAQYNLAPCPHVERNDFHTYY